MKNSTISVAVIGARARSGHSGGAGHERRGPSDVALVLTADERTEQESRIRVDRSKSPVAPTLDGKAMS